MSDATDMDRFEELDAGRVLGDLDAGEAREWEELSRKLGASPNYALDLAAAAVSATFAEERAEELPADLTERLRRDIASDPVSPSKIIRPPIWRRLAGGEVGWAVAALFAALLIATFLTRSSESTPPSVADAREQFVKEAPTLFAKDFTGVGEYEDIKGEVVWSDERQEGYMTFTNLPANDPSIKQYQLWIVDPERDEAPVDGGVFDIPVGTDSVVIPIDAKLAVTDPKAFVITLEQPGGVVKSKQEIVVALASL